MKSSQNKRIHNFNKLLVIQLYGYLALIPFIFAFFHLLKKHNSIDIIIFMSGVLLILVLLLMNHLEPSVKITPKRIIMYNIDRNKPVIIYRDKLKKVVKINSKTVKIFTSDRFYQIKLRKKQVNIFLDILKEST